MGNTQSAASNNTSRHDHHPRQVIFCLLQSALTSVNDEFADDERPVADESACYNNDGAFNDERFQEYLDRQRDEDLAKIKVRILLMQMLEEANGLTDESLESKLPLKRRRRIKTFFIDPNTSLARPITPTLSHWWILCLEDPKVDDTQWNKQFWNRFRLPYDSFLDLLHQIDELLENDPDVTDPF